MGAPVSISSRPTVVLFSPACFLLCGQESGDLLRWRNPHLSSRVQGVQGSKPRFRKGKKRQAHTGEVILLPGWPTQLSCLAAPQLSSPLSQDVWTQQLGLRELSWGSSVAC
jgi:hypothetical protein